MRAWPAHPHHRFCKLGGSPQQQEKGNPMSSDINDLLRERGPEAVREYMDSVPEVDESNETPPEGDPPPDCEPPYDNVVPLRPHGGGSMKRAPLIKASKQFVAGFVPPDYIVDGFLQEGFLYSLTGSTGAGKTAITL